MTMMINVIRFGRRQLHTIVSRDIIKPSSPTPSHLRTHNLSLLDQFTRNTFMPMVVFYPNNRISGSSHDKMFDLKNSLSQTLTNYYPFAGRHAKIAPSYVDCNDDGVEFLEASVRSTLSDFLHNLHHEDLDRFFPFGQIWFNENRGGHDLQSDMVVPLSVQVSHFECGGVAVAVSLSHKIADGGSVVHFLNDWANMTRFKQEFPIEPRFIPFPHINMNFNRTPLELSNDFITRSFIFSNSKINDLKNKVKSMSEGSRHPITNPTRVEVLSWLLYKCSVAAATKNNSDIFKPRSIIHLTNIRNKLMEPLPNNTIGNFFTYMKILTMNEGEMKPESYIGEMKKLKMQVKGLTNIKDALSHFLGVSSETTVGELQRKQIEETYICTSLCKYPTYKVNFGWGNPVKTAVGGSIKKNSFVLMDAANGDGIEAYVCLGKQDMHIVQTDPELLEFF